MPDVEQPISRKNETLVKLSSVADEFVFSEDVKLNLQDVLQECIDTYENYSDEVKKIKSLDHTDTKNVIESCKSAYVYYKIVHNFITKIIPHLGEFEAATGPNATALQAELIKIYYTLFSRLENDKKINYIKNIIIRYSESDKTNVNTKPMILQHKQDKSILMDDVKSINTKKSGSGISCRELLSLIKFNEDGVLLIDVRPKLEYDQNHIKTKNVICIEPISFKESYSDQQIEKISMIPSPKAEIQIFQRRDEFPYIVLYTDLEEKSNFYFQQLKALLGIIIQRSFSKPLDLNKTKVFFLSDSLQNWMKNGGEIEKSKEIRHIRPRGFSGGNGIIGMPLQERRTSGTIGHNMPSINPMPKSPLPPLPSTKADSIPGHGSFDAQSFRSTNYPQTPHITHSVPIRSLSTSPDPVTNINQNLNTRVETSSSPKLNGRNNVFPDLSRSYLLRKDLSNGSNSQHNPSINSRESTAPIVRSSSAEPQLPPMPSRPDKINRRDNKPKTPNIFETEIMVGLENMGNSCYINCIIQCILATHELLQIFLNGNYAKHINKDSKLGSKGVLSNNFAKLVKTMYEEGLSAKHGKKSQPVKTLHFKMACGSINSLFKDSSQQDCLEFCQFLLDGLHEDLNQCGANPPLKELSPAAEKMRENLSLRIASGIEWERYLTTDFSIIVDLFQGQYASQLRCKVCSRTSTTYQAFSVLSVPVPSGKSCSLLDCFLEFTKIENLEVEEEWFCPDCQKKQPSTKKLTITRLPKNLIIHLKRFDNMLNKNNIFVRYPAELDLTPFWANDFDGKLPPGITDEIPTRGQIPPFKYQLYAAACHFGSLYGGHYTSYVNKGSANGWIYFDDTVHRQVRFKNEFISPSAYVLFYHRTMEK
ncbi:Ubiquitin carboxyl-terminal hydrolase 4 [Nakaseomyces bracarensis]|uniref:ubiquitinyl hydrolase 1 n=1 Tax=Nakaseomyces bracarensis TaxID=273131 RepID=A0ABR4NZM9_9SACH